MKISVKKVLGVTILMSIVGVMMYAMTQDLGVVEMLKVMGISVVTVAAMMLGVKLIVEG